jgi:mannosyltransferase OCH1-like enzyme
MNRRNAFVLILACLVCFLLLSAVNRYVATARPLVSYFSTAGKYSIDSNYYNWAIADNEPEGNLRQRLADNVRYDPRERWHRNIFQSWRTSILGGEQYASWENKKEDFKHTFYLDVEQDSCVRRMTQHNLQDIELAYFKLLNKPVLRSDFFRYFAVWANGGIWADADTWLFRPFSEWMSLARTATNITGNAFETTADLEMGLGMIVGIEEYEVIGQYVFAARQGHPLLLEMIASIVERAPELAIGVDKDAVGQTEVLQATGPDRFTAVIESWIQRRWDPNFLASRDLKDLSVPKIFGDIAVFPQWVFGGQYPYHPDHPEEHNPEIYVGHEYRGSWVNHGKI